MRNQNSSGSINQPRPVKRSKDQRMTMVLIVFVFFSALTLSMSTLIRVNLEQRLQVTLQQVEKLQAENDALWDSVLVLQAENDVLKNQIELEPAIVYKTICSTNPFKSWMDYRTITSPSSKQHALQKKATTDKNYGFRMFEDYILVAMGPQYGPVGSKYIIQFEDGKVIKAMIGDIKHQGCTSDDGSMIEFIVDSNTLPKFLKTSGNFNQLFNGSIKMIREVE
ncbi:MAG TPA: hypothetical protein DCQ90_06540 [Erysipelotrichaceae bacterium]|nr:hypothetical protein [Erysipelotrichaceae bacterium]